MDTLKTGRWLFNTHLTVWCLIVVLIGAGFLLPVRASETAVTSSNGLVAATTIGDTHTAIGPGFMSRGRETAVYISWAAATTAGVVKVESANSEAYTGTWATLATVTFAGTAPNQDIVQITGIHGAIRTRVSTTLTGGSVSTFFVVN
jgi:hypothetical protein